MSTMEIGEQRYPESASPFLENYRMNDFILEVRKQRLISLTVQSSMQCMFFLVVMNKI